MSAVNVLRFSALAFGVFYGVTHQASISAVHSNDQINKEYQRKQDLIAKAKAEFVKKNMPKESKQPGGGLITDPEDPKFDLEAFLTMVSAGQDPKSA